MCPGRAWEAGSAPGAKSNGSAASALPLLCFAEPGAAWDGAVSTWGNPRCHIFSFDVR